MTHRTLKLINSQENFDILNSEPLIPFSIETEDMEKVVVEFDTQLDRVEMQVRLAKSSHPYPN